jgi:hypothetical protein
MKRAGVASETLDRVVPPLGHDFDASGEDGDKQNKQNNNEDIEAEHWRPSLRFLAKFAVVLP